MGKVYKGYELMKAIAEGEIKEGTTLVFKSTISKTEIKVKVHKQEDIGTGHYLRNENNEIISSGWLTNSTIEVLEDKEIDIQNLKGIEKSATTISTDNDLRLAYSLIHECENKINEQLLAIKQLDNKINKEYCQNCGVELNAENRALKNMCNECKYGLDR